MEQFDWGNELPTLHGQRVNLRWLTHDDAPEVFTVFGDPEVVRFWSSPPAGRNHQLNDDLKEVAAAILSLDRAR